MTPLTPIGPWPVISYMFFVVATIPAQATKNFWPSPGHHPIAPRDQISRSGPSPHSDKITGQGPIGVRMSEGSHKNHIKSHKITPTFS